MAKLKQFALHRYHGTTFFVGRESFRNHWSRFLLSHRLIDWLHERKHCRRVFRFVRSGGASVLDRDQKPANLTLGVPEPIRAPDAMQTPAKLHKHLMTKPVAVSRRSCAMVGDTIAFHADRKPARKSWVNNAEVDTKAGYADLRHHFIPVRSNYARDRFFKRTIRVLARDIARCNLARLG